MSTKGKSVTIKRHKDGSISFSSRGGVDLRKVVPQFFKAEQELQMQSPDGNVSDAAIIAKAEEGL